MKNEKQARVADRKRERNVSRVRKERAIKDNTDSQYDKYTNARQEAAGVEERE